MALTQVDDRLITSSAATIQISSGQLTIPSSYSFVRVDSEHAGFGDSLSTISAGVDGQRVVLSPENSIQTIQVKDGLGNIQLAGGDFVMNNVTDTLDLMYNAASGIEVWVEISRSNNV